jgi:thiol-disulfide isomerase/thioredoxin
MHRSLIVAIIVVLIFLLASHFTGCPCGCCMWCKCLGSGCCCDTKEHMRVVNPDRVATLHYTTWCSYCKAMRPVWEQVKLAVGNNGILFREINEELYQTPGVTTYPTIRMVTEGGTMVEYKGGANFTALRNWLLAPLR